MVEPELGCGGVCNTAAPPQPADPRGHQAASRNSAPQGVYALVGALCGLCALLLAPLLIADVPPVLDYPNHLARLVLLAAGPHDPVLGRIAVPNWDIIPNLAADALGLPLLRILPVHVAGRLLLAAILLINLLGVLALHRAAFGHRTWWPLVSGLAAYNSGFLLGFLNWQIGCGLAMLGAAAWIQWRERRPRAVLALGMLAAVALFFCHVMGTVFFLALIASVEVSAAPPERLGRVAWLLPLALPPLLLAMASKLNEAPAATHWMEPVLKLAQAASPFVNYLPWLDYLTAIVVFGGITLGVARGWCVVAPRLRPALAGLGLVYWPLPFDLKGGSFVDTRVALMLGFLVFAATDWSAAPRIVGRIVAATAVILLAVRMGVVIDVWRGQRQDLKDLRQAIAPVGQGSTVLFRNVSPTDAPTYWAAAPRHRWLTIGLRTDYHMPALLMIERGAWWQEFFANPAQQPILLRQGYAELARLGHALPPYPRMAEQPAGLARFDYVLMLEADADPANPVPECLEPLTRAGYAALYRTLDSPPCR